MSTTTKTWAWMASNEDWYDGGLSSDIVVDRTGAAGNPAGSLQWRISGRNKIGTEYGYISGTWAAIFGIPTNATVTHVRIYNLDTKCNEYNTVDEARYSDASGSNQNSVIYVGSSNLELWAGRTVTGVEGSWTNVGPGTNQAVPSGDQSASTTIAFRVYGYGDLNNSSSAAIALLFDNLTIEITYTEPSGDIYGSTTITITPEASIKADGKLLGSTIVTVTPEASIKADGKLSGLTTITITPEAIIKADGRLLGSITVTLNLTGTLEGPSGDIYGSTTITITPEAIIKADGKLLGSTTITITPEAIIKADGKLLGSTAITITPEAIIKADGKLLGSITVTVTPEAIIKADGKLLGSTTVTVTPEAIIKADGKLLGSATITLNLTGTLTQPVGSINGSTTITITPEASIKADGKLLGSTTITITPEANIKADGKLLGSTTITITPEASIKADGKLLGSTIITVTPEAIIKADGKLLGSTTITLNLTGTLTQPAGFISGVSNIALSCSGNLTAIKCIKGSSSITLNLTAIIVSNINYWDDTLNDGDGDNDLNWSLDHRPTPSEIAIFDNTQISDCNINLYSFVTKQLIIKNTYTGSLNITGRNWRVSGGIIDINGKVTVNSGGYLYSHTDTKLRIRSNADISGSGYIYMYSTWLDIFEIGGRIRCYSMYMNYAPATGVCLAPANYEMDNIWFQDNQYRPIWLFGSGEYQFKNIILTTSGSATQYLNLITNNPNFIINGNITIDINSSGSYSIQPTSNDFILKGNFVNEITGSGLFYINQQNVKLEGVSDQYINSCATNFGDITVNKSTGSVILTGNMTAKSINVINAVNIDFGDGFNHDWYTTNGIIFGHSGDVDLGNSTIHNLSSTTFDDTGCGTIVYGTSTLYFSGTGNILKWKDGLYNITIETLANIQIINAPGNYQSIYGTLQNYGLISIVSGYVMAKGSSIILNENSGTIVSGTNAYIGMSYIANGSGIIKNDGIWTANIFTSNCTNFGTIGSGTYANVYSQSSNIVLGANVTFDKYEISVGTGSQTLDLERNNTTLYLNDDWKLSGLSGGSITLLKSTNPIYLYDDLVNNLNGAVLNANGQDIILAGSTEIYVDLCNGSWGNVTLNNSSGIVATGYWSGVTFNGNTNALFDPNAQTFNFTNGITWSLDFNFKNEPDIMNGSNWLVGGNFSANAQQCKATAPWTLVVTGSAVANGAGSVAYSDARGGTQINASSEPWNDLGGNYNWYFGDLLPNWFYSTDAVNKVLV